MSELIKLAKKMECAKPGEVIFLPKKALKLIAKLEGALLKWRKND